MFWSSRIASTKPSTIEIAMNSRPKMNRLLIATSQRGAANRRSYWMKPSISYFGSRSYNFV